MKKKAIITPPTITSTEEENKKAGLNPYENIQMQIDALANLQLEIKNRIEKLEKQCTTILDFDDCLEFLKCKPATLRTWMHGKINPIPYHQPMGRGSQLFFFKHEIEAWLISKDKEAEIKENDFESHHAYSKAVTKKLLGIK